MHLRQNLSRKALQRFSDLALFFCTAFALQSCASKATAPTVVKAGNLALFPDVIADPLEPVNRTVWELNKGLLFGVIQPTGKVYRVAVPKPVRRSINHFSRNITYPARAANHLVQGRWDGAKVESQRFLTNTTVGVGGFFDVATKWNIPKSDANSGQTLGLLGWKQNVYLMLPVSGPSDDSHLAGTAIEQTMNPIAYLELPYFYASPVTRYNVLADQSEGLSRTILSNPDPYSISRYLWSYRAREDQPNWESAGPRDLQTLETLNAALIRCEDPNFPQQGKDMRVHLPSTGRSMRFQYWMQKGVAPLVIIAPGLSSHRLSDQPLYVAEQLYREGYSVVSTTSVFHPEFMENASTASVPGNPQIDSKDLAVFYAEIQRKLADKYPQRFSKSALVGISFGGFQAMRLAANDSSKKQALNGMPHFDRYITINAPVNLQNGIRAIDSFYQAPFAIPAEQRQEFINNAVHKVAKFNGYIAAKGAAALQNPPFNAIESKYITGLSFMVGLRDVIYSSQSRENLGVLQKPLSAWDRDANYNEILTYSFREYFDKFVIPHYRTKGVSGQALYREMDLRSHAAKLRGRKDIHMITNANDFLLGAQDVTWMKSTLGTSNVTVFPRGGHVGNLNTQPVKAALLEALKDLK